MATPPLFYVATSQHATSVNGSITGQFTGVTPTDLIIAKGAHVEIHSVTEEGLKPVYDVPLNGRIATMKLVRMAVRNVDASLLDQPCVSCVSLTGRSPGHAAADYGAL